MVTTRGGRIAARTLYNWALDAAVLVSALLAALSGIYFLYFPTGYQGGRNAAYSVLLLFPRNTWDVIHTWSGVVMVLAIIVHLSIHMDWVKNMGCKMWAAMRGGGASLSQGARVNVVVDLAVAVSFLLCAASGIYFLFAPAGGYQGGANPGWDAGFLFTRTTWDLIHTWSAVTLILAAIIHLAIHWRWVVNVTEKVWCALGAGLVRPAPAGSVNAIKQTTIQQEQAR